MLTWSQTSEWGTQLQQGFARQDAALQRVQQRYVEATQKRQSLESGAPHPLPRSCERSCHA